MSFELSYAGIPLLQDVAKVVRMPFKHAEGEDPRSLPPEKHQPLGDLIDELDRMLPFMYLEDFQLPGDYPGRDLGAVAYRSAIGPFPNPKISINSWYYPTTASRWSVFRGLATSTAVTAMIQATNFSQGQGCLPAEFVMHCDPLIAQSMTRLPDPFINLLFGAQNPATKYRLSSQMFMLPPRPLADHGSQFDGLYLVTLVDERYYYQYSPVSLKVRRGTTWNSLINQCAAAMGITIGFVDIPAVFQAPEPDSHLWSTMESAPVLLDAIAYNIGDVVIRLLDGSLKFVYSYESQTIAKVNRGNATQVLRIAGGELISSGIGNKVRNEVIPEAVKVTFPKYVIGNDPVPHFVNSRYLNQRATSWFEESFGEDYTVTVPIASGNAVFPTNVLARDFSPLSGLTGVRGIAHTIHDTAKALYDSEFLAATAVPKNNEGLVNLAMELGAIYFDYQTLEALDEVYPGTYSWIPEGYHDIIWTFSARAGRACTRVMKTQWNQMVREMQHGTPPPPGFAELGVIPGISELRPTGPYIPKGMGGPSVAQTIRDSEPQLDSSLARVNTLLAAPLTTTATTASFESVAYFPTQNRWRGRIESEDILFDGTSGGNAFGTGTNQVTIAYRAIDGTIPAAHPTESIVNQIAPSVTYGVNLTTYEKMSYTYPAEWTSGGIMGMNVVPQTQSVFTFDDVGKLLNGSLHYSGAVNSYDTTQQPAGQWGREELIWIIERNAGTVTKNIRYDGQLVGYSPQDDDSPVAPVYAINEDFSDSPTTQDCRLKAVDLYGNSNPDPVLIAQEDCPLPIQLINAALGGGYDTLRLDPCDFVVSTFGAGRCPGAFAASIKTRGETTAFTFLDPSCNPRTALFRDGLLQQVT